MFELARNQLCVQTTNLSFHLKALRRMFSLSIVCLGWCEWNPIMLYYGKFTLKTFNGSNILTSLDLLFLGVHCPCKSKSQEHSFLCVAVSRDQSEQHWKLILEKGICMFRWCAIIKWQSFRNEIRRYLNVPFISQMDAKAYNNNNKQPLKSNMTEYSQCKQKGHQ